MTKIHFSPLHNHSEYSILDGVQQIGPMVKHASEIGIQSMALTDHGAMYGMIEFVEECRSKQIKPIIGMEAYLAPRTIKDKEPEDRKSYHLVLLAENQIGYNNLCKMVSISNKDGYYYKPRIDKSILQEYNDGVIALTACGFGEFNSKLIQDDYNGACAIAQEYKDIFGENFYLEVQNHGLAFQNKIIPLQLEIAKKMDIVPVCTNDSHFIKKGQHKIQDLMWAINDKKTFFDANRRTVESEEAYLKTANEMLLAFSGHEYLVENTNIIANKISDFLDTKTIHFPNFPIPKNETNESYLHRLAFDGLEKRFMQFNLDISLRESYIKRMNYELEIINEKGFATYFLIVQDFVEYAKKNNYPVGVGRGSVGSSLVAWCLGITEIDPLKYNLVFERFLNPQRYTIPDIDIDFDPQSREHIIEYVKNKYGSEHVGHIITFNKMKARSSIRDAARPQGIPLSEVDKLAKSVPWGPNVTLQDAIKDSPDFKKYINEDAGLMATYIYAKEIEGHVRNSGVHPAGVIIGKYALDKCVPVQYDDAGTAIVQYDMNSVEKAGLIKMDFLGLRTLTYIYKTLELIKKRHNIDIDINNIDMSNKDVYKELSLGNTVGIFQLENSGMNRLLKDMRPDNINDIIACISLYRPGPMNSGLHHLYVKRKHGLEPLDYEHSVIEPILRDTYGVLTYQEQIAQLFVDMAGMTMAEAVSVLKVIGKKRDKSEIEPYRKLFTEGSYKIHQIDFEKSNKIFDEILEFAGYGFNKSHATAYGIIGYQTAWLKTFYPLEFYCAYLSTEMNNHDKILQICTEMKRKGIDILPPDINKSDINFAIDGNNIRYGLCAIKNVGEKAAFSILEERILNGKYDDIINFILRRNQTKVTTRVIESLILAGATSSLDGTRQQHLALFNDLLIDKNSENSSFVKNYKKKQLSLFEPLDNGGGGMVHYPIVVEPSILSQLNQERKLIGLYVSDHPMKRWPLLNKYITHKIEDLDYSLDGENVTLAGVICDIKEKTSKKKNKYFIFNLEDVSGIIECYVYGRKYDEFVDCGFFKEGLPILLKGKLQADDSVVDSLFFNETEGSNKSALRMICYKATQIIVRNKND